MNATSFYRHFETRSGHVFNPEVPRERFASRRRNFTHRRSFRFLGYVVLLLWEDGVFV